MFKKSLVFLFLLPMVCFASADAQAEHDPLTDVIFWITLIFSMAVLGRYLARKLDQPGVLGELLMGVLVGNLGYYLGLELMVVLREGSGIFAIIRDLLGGESLTEAVNSSISQASAPGVLKALSNPNGINYIKVGYALDMFSRFGVIFLLFMAGLESSVQELKHTGRESLQVAFIGVLAPVVLGFAVAWFMMPDASFNTALFVGATLSATSIGITARVLSDMKRLKTREARTILGAAMIDDVLGLIILAVVSSMVIMGQVEIGLLIQIISSTVVFFVAAILIGPWFLTKAVRSVDFLDVWEAKLFVSFFFVMALAWLATQVELSSIIGAFAAGMIINDTFFQSRERSKQHALTIRQLISPLEFILAPLFFMLIGMQVKLESFFDGQVLWMAGGLILAAILGKLISGLGAHKQDDRMLVGIGMLPRGEVGLVFASIGRTLGVLSDQMFSSVILMVIVTTFVTPPLLKRRYAKNEEVLK